MRWPWTKAIADLREEVAVLRTAGAALAQEVDGHDIRFRDLAPEVDGHDAQLSDIEQRLAEIERERVEGEWGS